MRSFLLLLFLTVLTTTASVQAQAVLSVSIHIPTVTVNQNTQAYEPMPIEVTATVYNTGSSASASLMARVSLSPGLELDSSEQHVTLKAPVPSVVNPGDSAKVRWNIVYPPAFSMKNYRVYVWLKSAPDDSSMTSALFTIPAIPPPDLLITPTGIPALTMRADSMGYDGNPFDVNVRFSNAGGTTADSVTLALILPPDYELDPPTQDNPIVLQQPLAPAAQGGQRLYLAWTVRYTAATRTPRVDSLRIHAHGIDLAGGDVDAEDTTTVTVPGMNPVVSISFRDPGGLQYDTSSIYYPLPYPLIMRLENNSAQWTVLGGVELDILGEGWSSTDPFSQSLPALAPGSFLDLTWDVDVERRRFQRQLLASVEVTDGEGYPHAAQRSVPVPGKPYDLVITDVQLPDSLGRSPDGTQLLTHDIPVSFQVRNDTWYNSTLQYSKVQTQGEGILAPPWKEQQHATFLLPGGSTAALRDTFRVEAALKDRVVALHLLAISDRGDTARGSGSVRIPGVQPVLTLTRRGPEELFYQPGGTYAPNPFTQEYVLRNEGHVTVRVDSLLLRYPADGVVTPQPLRRDIGWDLLPGDSLVTQWNFTAYVRDTLRRLPMQVTAFVSREYAVSTQHVLEIPALFPILSASVEGPDTLAYDPDSLYAPNPVTRTLLLMNMGTADLVLDSVRLRWNDALLRAESPLTWTTGKTLAPDSTLALPFVLRADAHETETVVPLEFTVYHAGTKQEQVLASLYLPALRPGLDATVLGNAQLLTDEVSIYRPDPFEKIVRIANSGTADLQVDSVTVSVTDPGISVVEGSVQHVGSVVPPGSANEMTWHFHTLPHASSGYVVIRFTLYHSGGETLPLQSDIFVPGEPFAFDLTDVDIPDRLFARSDGQGYEGNPVVLRFRAENDAWFASTLRLLRVRVKGDGVDMLTQQPRNPAIDLSAHETSAVLRDSLFVFPASYDRVIRVFVQTESSRGLGDSTWKDIFVPKITATSTAQLPIAEGLSIGELHPNPWSAGTAPVLHVTVRSGSPFRMEVYDLLGRLRHASALLAPAPSTRVERIPVNDLPQGGYLLRVRSGDEVRTQRFIVLR